MAVIRQSQAERIVRDAIVLDLGDLTRQADALRARAKADAEAILTKAAAERQRLITGAREEGLAKGLEEGTRQGTEEGRKQGTEAALAERRDVLAKLEAAWAAALDEFARERERMLLDARQDVLRLAVMMGERITKRTVEVDPSVIAGQMEAVLALLAKPTRLTIAIAPADEDLARGAMPALMARFSAAQHIDLIVDPSLTQGSCVARTGAGGTIDATIPAQLDRMVAALMPGERKEGNQEQRSQRPALPDSSAPSSPPATPPEAGEPPQGPPS
jgi:flagellar assembly protein FliH